MPVQRSLECGDAEFIMILMDLNEQLIPLFALFENICKRPKQEVDLCCIKLARGQLIQADIDHFTFCMPSSHA